MPLDGPPPIWGSSDGKGSLNKRDKAEDLDKVYSLLTKAAFNITKAVPGAGSMPILPTDSVSIGAAGYPAAALAGFTLSAASELLRQHEAGQKPSRTVPVGTLERAILAEAALRLAENLIASGHGLAKEIELTMKQHINEIAIPVEAAAHLVLDSVTEPVFRIFLNTTQQTIAKGHAYDAFSPSDEEFWKNRPSPLQHSDEAGILLEKAFDEGRKKVTWGQASEQDLYWGPVVNSIGKILVGPRGQRREAEKSITDDGNQDEIFSSVPWRPIGQIGWNMIKGGHNTRRQRVGIASETDDSDEWGEWDLLGGLFESGMADAMEIAMSNDGSKFPESSIHDWDEEFLSVKTPLLSDVLKRSTMADAYTDSGFSWGQLINPLAGSLVGDLLHRAVLGEAALTAILQLPQDRPSYDSVMDDMAHNVKDISPGLPKYATAVMKTLLTRVQLIAVKTTAKHDSDGKQNEAKDISEEGTGTLESLGPTQQVVGQLRLKRAAFNVPWYTQHAYFFDGPRTLGVGMKNKVVPLNADSSIPGGKVADWHALKIFRNGVDATLPTDPQCRSLWIFSDDFCILVDPKTNRVVPGNEVTTWRTRFPALKRYGFESIDCAVPHFHKNGVLNWATFFSGTMEVTIDVSTGEDGIGLHTNTPLLSTTGFKRLDAFIFVPNTFEHGYYFAEGKYARVNLQDGTLVSSGDLDDLVQIKQYGYFT